MTLPSIQHVMIAIPLANEDRARDFYVGLLGLQETEKPASLAGRGGLWLETGSISLHLGIDPNFVPARKAHIALLVDDLDAFRSRLTESAVAPGEVEFELPGFRRCYVDDPFGNRIELMQAL